VATYIFPNFSPYSDGKDGLNKALYPATTEFPHMDATADGKDGESRAAWWLMAGKAVHIVGKIFVRLQGGDIVEATGFVNTPAGIAAIEWCVCVGGGVGSPPSGLIFPHMDATADGKDGGSITQAEAENKNTYPWCFDEIWYMGPKYPLLR